jgi:hypothetical protein
MQTGHCDMIQKSSRCLILDSGEAVPALRPAGILPAEIIKGKMPSPHPADLTFLKDYSPEELMQTQERQPQNGRFGGVPQTPTIAFGGPGQCC